MLTVSLIQFRDWRSTSFQIKFLQGLRFLSVYALCSIIKIFLIRFVILHVANMAHILSVLTIIYFCGAFLFRILKILLRHNHLYKKLGLTFRLTKTVNAFLFMISVDPVRLINIQSVFLVRLLHIYVVARVYVIRHELLYIAGILLGQ